VVKCFQGFSQYPATHLLPEVLNDGPVLGHVIVHLQNIPHQLHGEGITMEGGREGGKEGGREGGREGVWKRREGGRE
jgi:hypothetical protein